ncbi:MAG: NIPSNAP family protein [Saprospiraceae bacterium]|nr:NIPSNAP family protein [Saprospiraceae bacterium]
MKIRYILLIIIACGMLSCQKKNIDILGLEKSNKPMGELYQLKVFTFKSDSQVNMTDTYLRDAFLPAMKRMGHNNVGVFKQRRNAPDSIQKTFVLIPFSNLNQILKLEEELSKDKNYLENGDSYINTSFDKPPYSRIETIILKAFEGMPALKPTVVNGIRSERIYELRSYESATEHYNKSKVDMFNAGGEIKLFDRLGFNAVFFGEVISGPKMPNLMYMTSFTDMAGRDAHWKTFVEDPEWGKLKVIPKYLNTVSHIDIYFLTPTEYSDY